MDAPLCGRPVRPRDVWSYGVTADKRSVKCATLALDLLRCARGATQSSESSEESSETRMIS
jgi:hypothetical protein